MFETGISPELYQIQGKSYDFPDMTNKLCPHCKGDYLKKHGFYKRYLVTIAFEGEIIIRRHYCKECERTVSLLPSFCHPRRTYGVLVIFGLLKTFYIKMSSVCTGVINFYIATGVECSRQLLLHYRTRVEQNLNSLIMAVTDIYGLKAPIITKRAETTREKVRQLLSRIQYPQDDSLKIFERTGASYLTKQAS